MLIYQDVILLLRYKYNASIKQLKFKVMSVDHNYMKENVCKQRRL